MNTIMKYQYILILFFLAQSSFSQSNIEVFNTQKVVGTSLINNTTISGEVHKFQDNIYKFLVDTVSDIVTMQFKKENIAKTEKYSRYIIAYDLNESTIRWKQPFGTSYGSILQSQNLIIHNDSYGSNKLNPVSGHKEWSKPKSIYFLDSKTNFALAFKKNNNDLFQGYLQGINASDGSVYWQRPFERKYYGWDNVYFIEDSTLMVISSGLHTVNINTGKGWDYKADIVNETYGSITTDLHSNVLIDSSCVYFSSRGKFSKIDRETGRVFWSKLLPDKCGTRANVLTDDSTVYLINFGLGRYGYYPDHVTGKPVIAAFDKVTGRQKYFKIFHKYNDPIYSYHILDNKLYLLFRNKIEEYNLHTGSLLNDLKYKKKESPKFRYFAGSHVYIKNDYSKYESIYKADTSKLYVLAYNNILVFNSSLEVDKTHHINDLYIRYFSNDRRDLIAKYESDTTFIIDKTGDKIAEIKASKNAVLFDNILYDIKDNSFFAIDLSAILKKN